MQYEQLNQTHQVLSQTNDKLILDLEKEHTLNQTQKQELRTLYEKYSSLDNSRVSLEQRYQNETNALQVAIKEYETKLNEIILANNTIQASLKKETDEVQKMSAIKEGLLSQLSTAINGQEELQDQLKQLEQQAINAQENLKAQFVIANEKEKQEYQSILKQLSTNYELIQQQLDQAQKDLDEEKNECCCS